MTWIQFQTLLLTIRRTHPQDIWVDDSLPDELCIDGWVSKATFEQSLAEVTR